LKILTKIQRKEDNMHKKLCIIMIVVTIFALSSVVVVPAEDKTPTQLVKEAKAAIKEVSIHDLKKR
jgi:hypothetical protein